ncbi:putative BOI-related E3 ubiquitin-protein ligase 3 [Canna indica]|uniref:BOI-related E3 ubiquitin-protein ligase 3 n=1 Tax=Canna indica TaxID=4628 RepID=A0AAQ3QP02_9LILI|nr:putative BOI-related E3 ubiquitin-protein ligase 3 [Canna indica]
MAGREGEGGAGGASGAAKAAHEAFLAALDEGVSKRLKAKDEEIARIEKLNWALEERIKSLCVDNQVWRDMVQNNEATTNVLRNNLEQVLSAQMRIDPYICMSRMTNYSWPKNILN